MKRQAIQGVRQRAKFMKLFLKIKYEFKPGLIEGYIMNGLTEVPAGKLIISSFYMPEH